MSKISKITNLLGSGRKCLKKILLYQEMSDNYGGDNNSNNCEITLSKGKNDNDDICLIFKKVRNLEFRGGPYQTINLVGLQIEDNSLSQISDMAIRVASEDDISYICFYCSDVEIINHSR